MSLFADVLKHTSAGHFPEASLMVTRTRSAGSFCLDCSHRKLHPCLTGDLLLPGPRQSAHLLPVPQISSGGRSLLVSLGAAAGFLPVRPDISCLLPSPGWLSPIRQPPSGAWAQIPGVPSVMNRPGSAVRRLSEAFRPPALPARPDP